MRISLKRASALALGTGLVLAALPVVAQATAPSRPSMPTVDKNPAKGMERAAKPKDIRVLTWNICGTPKSDPTGKHPCRNQKPKDKIQSIYDHVTNRDPKIDVIMTQESCKQTHTIALQKKLGGHKKWKRYTWKSYGLRGSGAPGTLWGCPRTGDPGSSKNAGGVGILMKYRKNNESKLVGYKVEFKRTAKLPITLGKPQGAACIKDKANKVLACTSHFAGGTGREEKELRTKSAESLSEYARKWEKKGWHTIVGGDFNAEPGEPPIDVLKKGRKEADKANVSSCDTSYVEKKTQKGCHESDPARKIDYIFFDDKNWGKLTHTRFTGVLHWSQKWSDHWRLVAEAKLK